MRRFGRWMFNGLAVMSLLLFLAIVSLWIRSYQRSDTLVYPTAQDQKWLWAGRGSLTFMFLRDPPYGATKLGPEYFTTRPQADDPSDDPIGPAVVHNWRFAGFRWYEGQGGAITSGNPPRGGGYTTYMTEPPRRIVQLPLWFLSVFLLILPARKLALGLRGRRLPGHCPKCGYNVSGVCPECGKPIENVVQAK